MLKRCLLGLLCLTLLTAAKAEEYRPPFNGKDLDRWLDDGPMTFKDCDATKPTSVALDAMTTSEVDYRKSIRLLPYAKQEVAEFALHVEYRMPVKAAAKASVCNSGIRIRTLPF